MSKNGEYIVSQQAQLTKEYSADAGLDIRANAQCIIRARSSALVSTGLRLHVPAGHVGLIWPRSGLSAKHNIETGAGCIDSGYHGEIIVKLYNHGELDYIVSSGDKIAQLLTIPINLSIYYPVASLEESSRGENGFGSTGV